MTHNLIQSDPDVMTGKPVVRGTRITVETILRKLSCGESIEQIFLSGVGDLKVWVEYLEHSFNYSVRFDVASLPRAKGLPPELGGGALQQGLGALLLAQHGHQQVLGLDVGVVVGQGQALGLAQGFLELGGEFVESHDVSL